MSDGDSCPRCQGTNTVAMIHWDDVELVCDDCGLGT